MSVLYSILWDSRSCVLVKQTLLLLAYMIDIQPWLFKKAPVFGYLGDGVIIQLVIFEESLSLFARGNTFPAPTSSWRMCYPCL